MPRLSAKRKRLKEKMKEARVVKRQRTQQQPIQPGIVGEQGKEKPHPASPPRVQQETAEPQPGTSKDETSPAMLKRRLRAKVRVPRDDIRPAYMIVEKSNLLKPQAKCQKCESHLEHRREVANRYGGAYQLSEKCQVCGEVTKYWTSPRQLPTGVFDINVKLVEFALGNSGYKTIQDMEVMFESKLLTHNRFFEIARRIEEGGIADCQKKLEMSRQLIHKYLEHLNPQAPKIKNVEVTCDGTWSKRGFISKFGVVIVIHHLTGLVIDYELLSKHCAFCEKHSDDEGDWYDAHMDECNKNFEGSSPAMEAEGWLRLFRRSVKKCKMRYVAVISDGDSKAYSSIEKEQVYGDIQISKEECINHVAKRVGKLLRDFVMQKSKKGEGVSGKRPGSLTAAVISKLQDYYRYAIINNKGDTAKMRQAIYATLEHCSSTDEEPHHDKCPEGKSSWCFYQRLLAEGKDVTGPEGNHHKFVHVKLRREIATELMPLYARLATDALLKKCTGYTQNANESINSVIWSNASKTVFYQRKRLEYLVSKGIITFNLGYQHAVTTDLGPVGFKTTASMEKDKKAKAEKAESRKEERRSRKAKTLAEEEKKREEEGTTYEAGAF